MKNENAMLLLQIALAFTHWCIGMHQKHKKTTHIREVKRTHETRRVRFRWRVRERVWCWYSIWPGRATRPDESKASDSHARSSQIWYEKASCMPNRVRSGTKTPSKHPHKYWGGLDFRGLFIFWLFFSFARQSFFFFDHADCGTCFTLEKNGIVIVTRHSDENAHTEVQHLPSAAFLDRFLRSRPGQLPKLNETFLHWHSILHDRLLNEREKIWHRDDNYRHAPCQRDFLTPYSSATRHEWLNLFSSRHECFTSDSGLTRTRLVSCVLWTSLYITQYLQTDSVCITISSLLILFFFFFFYSSPDSSHTL